MCLRRAERKCRELDPRRQPELREDVAKVEVNRAGAEKQLGGDLAVREALCDEPCYLKLLRSETVELGWLAAANLFSCGSKLSLGALGPGGCTERFEILKRVS